MIFSKIPLRFRWTLPWKSLIAEKSLHPKTLPPSLNDPVWKYMYICMYVDPLLHRNSTRIWLPAKGEILPRYLLLRQQSWPEKITYGVSRKTRKSGKFVAISALARKPILGSLKKKMEYKFSLPFERIFANNFDDYFMRISFCMKFFSRNEN